MPFTSKWLDWTPPKTSTQRTDITDEISSVSFVSASSKRFQGLNVTDPRHLTDTDARDHLLEYSFAVEAAAESFPTPRPSRCAACANRLTDRFIGLLHGAKVCNAPGLDCLIKYGTQRKRHGVEVLRRQGVEPPSGWTLPDGSEP